MPPLDFWAEREWNVENPLEIGDFLQEAALSPDDQNRLRTLGNVVVPQQACLAMSVLSRMLDGQFFS